MDSGVDTQTKQEFVVGGVRLPRPFRIRRLGHFGVNVNDPEASRRFYEGLLGFRISDPIDFKSRLPAEEVAKLGPTVGYFSRHGTDHHSFVFFPRRLYNAMAKHMQGLPEVTINQITWQVGSLREVTDGCEWFKQRGRDVHRSGRDLPGSNWHFYPPDPDGHTNEIYYGIEQVGWDGFSKPLGMHKTRYMKPPELPHRSEYAEVSEGLAAGVDPRTGWAQKEMRPETFDVGGVLLGRPFKVSRVGPVRLFVQDVERALGFYRDELGLTVTEEVVWRGQRCVFLRANTEHHSLALYPIALRGELGLSPHTTLFSFGLQVGDYQQLRDAAAFLKREGVAVKHLPQELFPGIDYSAFAIDPDGHAMQLYYYMEQVGWDGRPRPAGLRPKVDNQNWPETVPAATDTFSGEIYLGPLN
jgi:catechol 2,3-dioxygenase-like lactoylglutathione lyase family enzyme